jgi:hypothetical protein
VRDRRFLYLSENGSQRLWHVSNPAYNNHLEQHSLPIHTTTHDAKMVLTLEQGAGPGKRPYSPPGQFTGPCPAHLAPAT